MRKESIEIGSISKAMNMHSVWVARNIIIKIVCKYPGSSNTALFSRCQNSAILTKTDNTREVQYLEVTVHSDHLRKASFMCVGKT